MELFDRKYANEFALFADVIASTKKPIDAFCIVSASDDQKGEAAYWMAVRFGAQHCGFWVVGESPKIKSIDAQHHKVTKWIDNIENVPAGNVVILDAIQINII